jgi:hypothetical protein
MAGQNEPHALHLIDEFQTKAENLLNLLITVVQYITCMMPATLKTYDKPLIITHSRVSSNCGSLYVLIPRRDAEYWDIKKDDLIRVEIYRAKEATSEHSKASASPKAPEY